MKYNSHGFAIIIAVGFMLLMSLIGIFLLEYMIPFSRSVKGVENATNAYYQAYGGVEEAVLKQKSVDVGDEISTKSFSTAIDYSYSSYSSGKTIPRSGYGDSPFNDDWNIISQTQPIQLEVGYDMLAPNTDIAFQVPDFDGNGSSDSLDTGIDLILWQLASSSDTLSTATGQLLSSSTIPLEIGNIGGEQGIRLDRTPDTFSSFYTSHCRSSGSGCILKITMIATPTSGSIPLPFLEYQIEVNGGGVNKKIPLRASHIDVEGRSYNYKKQLRTSIYQDTTNAAFDFTVFQ